MIRRCSLVVNRLIAVRDQRVASSIWRHFDAPHFGGRRPCGVREFVTDADVHSARSDGLRVRVALRTSLDAVAEVAGGRERLRPDPAVDGHPLAAPVPVGARAGDCRSAARGVVVVGDDGLEVGVRRARGGASRVLRQVENVTTRVSPLVGFHTVEHQTFIEYPSMLLRPEEAPLPQQATGGLAFWVEFSCRGVADVLHRELRRAARGVLELSDRGEARRGVEGGRRPACEGEDRDADRREVDERQDERAALVATCPRTDAPTARAAPWCPRCRVDASGLLSSSAATYPSSAAPRSPAGTRVDDGFAVTVA